MSDAKAFDRLEKEFFDTWMRRNPLFAVQMGFHKYDTAMPDGSVDRELEDHRLLKRFLARFQAIEGASLPPSRRIDRDLFIHVLRLRLFEAEDLRFWESIPEAPAVLGRALFQVFASDHEPLPERLRRLTERMEKMPRYIRDTRAKLTRPAKVWVDTELETIARLPSYFDTVKQSGRITLTVREYDRMCRAIEGVQNTMEDYANWIIIDVLPRCRKEFAIGPEAFARLLERRGIDATPEALIAFGWRQFKWYEAMLKRLAHKIKSGAPVEEIHEMVRASHPNSFADVLNTVRDAVKRTREIVARSGFATLPEGDELRVMETPVFLRHRIPFGAYVPPARFDPKPTGIFFVTPGEVDRDRLKEHNHAALANMSVHEGYPGHHLQFACAARHPSLARVFAAGVESVEGWAHYCEEEMKRLGFDTALKSRFVQTQNMLWRAARVIVDVRLATGKMGVDEAILFLMRSTGMERPAATAEIRRYTRTPGIALSYLYGKEKIKELKAACRKHLGRHFSERFFHDTILYGGTLPLKLLKRELEWKMEEELKKPKEAPRPPEAKGAKGKGAPARLPPPGTGPAPTGKGAARGLPPEKGAVPARMAPPPKGGAKAPAPKAAAPPPVAKAKPKGAPAPKPGAQRRPTSKRKPAVRRRPVPKRKPAARRRPAAKPRPAAGRTRPHRPPRRAARRSPRRSPARHRGGRPLPRSRRPARSRKGRR